MPRSTPRGYPWDSNEIQFARLICEICWHHDINVDELKESMGLTNKPHMFDALLERARRVYMDYLKDTCGDDESQFKPLVRGA